MRHHPIRLDGPEPTLPEPGRLPLLPLKNDVIFPRNVVTLSIARARSIHAIEEALSGDQELIVTTHRDAIIDDPEPEDMYDIGTRVDGRPYFTMKLVEGVRVVPMPVAIVAEAVAAKLLERALPAEPLPERPAEPPSVCSTSASRPVLTGSIMMKCAS